MFKLGDRTSGAEIQTQREGARCPGSWERGFPHEENCKCKGPEVGMGLGQWPSPFGGLLKNADSQALLPEFLTQ